MLTPEKARFKDAGNFRQVWQEYASLKKGDDFFWNPQKALEVIGFGADSLLSDDWKNLEIISIQMKSRMPSSYLILKFPQEHRMRFFLNLLWQTLEIKYQMVHMSMRSTALESKIQYEIMTLMVNLEQWLDDNQRKMKMNQYDVIRENYQELISWYWLRIYDSSQLYIHMRSLRYMKEEIVLLSKRNNPDSLIGSYDVQHQQNMTEKESRQIEKSDSIYEMIDEMSQDLQDLQRDVKKKAEDLQMYEEPFLKPAEVCKKLEISSQTLSNWRKQGRFKTYKEVGNRFEYSEKEVLEIKKQQLKG